MFKSTSPSPVTNNVIRCRGAGHQLVESVGKWFDCRFFFASGSILLLFLFAPPSCVLDMTEGTNDTKPDVASRWQARLRDTDVSSEAVAEISAQLEPALRRKFLELVDEYHEKIRTVCLRPV